MIQVTVIVPVFNVEKYIRECFESVALQNYPYLTCMFIDDGSTDASFDILQKKIDSYNGPINFKLLKNDKNLGASGTRNRGIRESQSDYIYFLDSDDAISSTCIDELVYHVFKHPGVDIVQGEILSEVANINHVLKISGKRYPDYSCDIHWVRANIFNSLPISPCNKLIRLDILKRHEIYFMEGIVNEDVLWTYHLRKYIKSLAFNFRETYFYRHNPNSVTISVQNERRRLVDQFFILDSFLQDIDSSYKEVDNFGILKQYSHVKLMTISPENQEYFIASLNTCIRKALNTQGILKFYKPFFYYLTISGAIFGRSLFIWRKFLGILFRYNKVIDKQRLREI